MFLKKAVSIGIDVRFQKGTERDKSNGMSGFEWRGIGRRVLTIPRTIR